MPKKHVVVVVVMQVFQIVRQVFLFHNFVTSGTTNKNELKTILVQTDIQSRDFFVSRVHQMSYHVSICINKNRQVEIY